jgi:hypothetical protein
MCPKTLRHWLRFPKNYIPATAGPGEKAIGVDGVADRSRWGAGARVLTGV